MRHVLFAAAAVAACGFLATTAASAQTYQPGGPARIGNMCLVVTDANDDTAAYGYYAPCGAQALAQAPARRAPRAQAFQGAYEPGGRARVGNMCIVVTDANDETAAYGYYEPCRR